MLLCKALTPSYYYCYLQGYDSTYEKDKHYGERSYSISSKVSEIQTEIMTNGPVESAFRVYGDFPTYRSG